MICQGISLGSFAKYITTVKSVENQLPNMEEVNLRFDHLGGQIFDSLDNVSLVKCKEVSRPWKTFVENQKFLYTTQCVGGPHKLNPNFLS